MPIRDAGASGRATHKRTVAPWALGVGAVRAFAALWALVLVVLAPAVALAHPLIEEGKRKYEEADFQGALDAFARAEQATDLTRDDIVQLYTRRAMVHHAMRHPEDLEADAFRLANLDREVRLPRSAPPPVRRAYEQAVARVTALLRVDVEAAVMPGGTRLVARVTDDNAGLVQALRVRARTAGGVWRRSERASLEFPAAAGATVEFVAEAVGPGGAVLATAGTDAAPLRMTIASAVAAVTVETRAEGAGDAATGGAAAQAPAGGAPSDEGGGMSPWPWVIGGGVALVAAAIVIVLLVPGTQGDQPVSGPMVTF